MGNRFLAAGGTLTCSRLIGSKQARGVQSARNFWRTGTGALALALAGLDPMKPSTFPIQYLTCHTTTGVNTTLQLYSPARSEHNCQVGILRVGCSHSSHGPFPQPDRPKKRHCGSTLMIGQVRVETLVQRLPGTISLADAVPLFNPPNRVPSARPLAAQRVVHVATDHVWSFPG